jgi:hypothetical protein
MFLLSSGRGIAVMLGRYLTGYWNGLEQDIVSVLRHYQGKRRLWKLGSSASIKSKLPDKATAEQTQQQILPHARLPPGRINHWQMAFFSLFVVLGFKYR